MEKIAMPGTYIEIALRRPAHTEGGLSVARDASMRIGLPTTIDPDTIKTALRDTELLGEMLRKHGDQIQRALNASVYSENTELAAAIAKEIGFSEREFLAKGGGLWRIILIAVACALACKGG